MSAPTPGPLVVRAADGGMRIHLETQRGVLVATAYSMPDAELFAASHDLLASVEEEVAVFESTRANHLLQGDEKIVEILDMYHGERIARARAALAKARGVR